MNRKPKTEKEALLRAIATDGSTGGISPNTNETFWLKKIIDDGKLGGIKDVTELPNTYGWKGTALPANSTVIENLYFNQNLSIEETVSILEKANLPFETRQANTINIELNVCYTTMPLAGSDVEHLYIILYVPSYDCWAIGNIIALNNLYAPTTEGYQILFLSKPLPELGLTLEGWDKSIKQPIVYNEPVINENLGVVIIELQGALPPLDKLSSLISSTPFEKETFNDKAIYRLNETTTKYNGTPLVCNSDTYVENIYLNLSLSNDEILNILKSLPYNDSSKRFNVIYTTPNETLTLYAYKYGEDYYLCCNPSSLGLHMYTILWSYQGGWEQKTTVGDNFNVTITNNSYIIHTNSVGNETYDFSSELLSAGVNNDLVSGLISGTPFTETKIPTGESDLYTYDGEWCKLVKEKELYNLLLSSIEHERINLNINDIVTGEAWGEGMNPSNYRGIVLDNTDGKYNNKYINLYIDDASVFEGSNYNFYVIVKGMNLLNSSVTVTVDTPLEENCYVRIKYPSIIPFWYITQWGEPFFATFIREYSLKANAGLTFTTNFETSIQFINASINES